MKEGNPGKSKVCGGKTRSGGKCKKPPMTGRTRCRLHGGATPVGIMSPHFKTGKYSKYLPPRLLERYHESLEDGELLALREEIALVDTRLADLLTRVDRGESKGFWRLAKTELSKYTKALNSEDVDEEKTATHLFNLRQIINGALDDYGAWSEIHSALEQRRRLVESESKRLSEMRQFITAEKAMVLIANLTDIIKRHVTDRATLAAISNELIRLTSVDASRIVDG